MCKIRFIHRMSRFLGNFTVEETKSLAGILNAGALPVHLEEIYSTSVGAQFGEQALNKTVFAGIVGIALIFIFMLLYYRRQVL